MVAKGDDGAQLRIGTIDRILRTRRAVTLGELAEELGVSQRSVCRYLAHMRRDLHLPVAHSPQHHYHYASDMAGKPPGGEETNTPARPSPVASGTMAAAVSVLERVHEALYTRRKLVVTGPGIGSPAYIAHPYFLSRVAGELYLFGGRPCQRALVNIPLAQILMAEVLDETFDDDLAEGRKLRHGQGWLPSGSRHAVSLRFPTWAAWASQLKICLRQRLEGSGHYITIRFLADDLEEVRRFVLALGETVTVLEPAVLRSQLRAYLDSPQEGYSPLPQERDSAPDWQDLRKPTR